MNTIMRWVKDATEDLIYLTLLLGTIGVFLPYPATKVIGAFLFVSALDSLFYGRMLCGMAPRDSAQRVPDILEANGAGEIFEGMKRKYRLSQIFMYGIPLVFIFFYAGWIAALGFLLALVFGTQDFLYHVILLHGFGGRKGADQYWMDFTPVGFYLKRVRGLPIPTYVVNIQAAVGFIFLVCGIAFNA